MIDFASPEPRPLHDVQHESLQPVSQQVCEDVFADPSTMTLSEWADEYRRLSTKSSAEPGRFSTDRVPYMRFVQDLLTNDEVREVVAAKSAQVGCSTINENWIGYTMHQDPSGFLAVWPTEKALRNWSKLRLKPLIEESPALALLFPQSGRRSADDAIETKIFPGGYLAGLSSKSTADLRSFSARRASAEEVDEWDADVGEQGDPLDLLRARLRAFWNSKLLVISTPTVKGFSRIWTELESSTWHQFWVPCPHCQHMQTLRWQDEEEYGHAKPGTYRLLYERDAAGDLIPGSCRYVCEECGCEIEEKHKQWMLERGEWRARFPERWPGKVGVHINTIYSPLVGWDALVTAFIAAVRDPAKMKGFVNTWLGLPYEESAEKIDAHFLKKRAEAYRAEVPRGVGLLTAFADVQADRLELFVWGWGAEERAWVIRWKQLWGDPGQPDVWKQLDEWLYREWIHEDGATMQIAVMLVDAGYHTEAAWQYARDRRSRRVLATVGRDGRGRKLIEAPEPEKFKRSRSKKRPMHVIGVDSGKDLVAGRLKLTEPDAQGYIHFPDDPEVLDPTFFDQLTAEKLVTKYKKKRPVRVWELLPNRRNEALDGAVGNFAALYYCGPKVINQLGDLAAAITARGEELRAGAVAAATQQTPRRRMLSRGING